MRIEGVGLEHHRDVAVLGLHVVDSAVADVDVALGDLFQARQQPKAGRLAAAGRANEDEELLVRDFEVEVVYGRRAFLREALGDVFVPDARH